MANLEDDKKESKTFPQGGGGESSLEKYFKNEPSSSSSALNAYLLGGGAVVQKLPGDVPTQPTNRGRSGSGPSQPPQCSCPSTVSTVSDTAKYFQCPVCLAKFDKVKIPVGLNCGHSLCLNCARLLVPGSCGGNVNTPPSLDALDLSVGLPNLALLAYLDQLDQTVEHFVSAGRLRINPGK
jgi:hypothetical protein